MTKRILILIGLVLLASFGLARADARDDFKDTLEARQQTVVASFDQLHTRVNGMNSRDPKKDGAKDLLDIAEDKVDEFKGISAADHILGEGPFEPDDVFKDAERAANRAINDVNVYIFSPARPGDEEGTVPQGKLVEDFIPQVIRQLFRFVSIAILITIIVAAVMLVTAKDDEERHTTAKKMLLYALIGFVFTVLAFALVKAITAIDFFRVS